MQRPNQEKPEWAKQFKIDDATWSSLCEQASVKNVTPLACALESGLLNENKLISWDRDNSGVASLKTVFFNGAPPVDLWAQYDFTQCRAAGCMPVATWEGHTLWAKLSSETTGLETTNPNGLWFLAPWTGMKKWFDSWESSVKKSEPAARAPSLDAPAGLSLSADDLPPIPDDVLPEIPGAPPLEAPVGMSAPVAESSEEFLAPVGIQASGAADVSLDFSSVGLADETDQTPAQTGAEPISKTAEPAAKASPRVEPHDGELSVNLDLGLSAGTPQAKTSPAHAPQGQRPPATAAPKPPTVSKAPPAPKAPVAPKAPPPPPMPPIPGTPAAGPGAAVASTAGIPTVSYDQLEGRMKVAASQDALANTLIGAWQNHFEQVMILLFQQEKLIPWWFNSKWKTQVKRGEAIALDTPSIFKIVVDTGKPYHGYVSQGRVNDDFFRRFNNGDYPEHVTVVPVLAGDRVVAMLMGLCSKETGKQAPLNMFEDHGRLFSAALTKLASPIQKAG